MALRAENINEKTIDNYLDRSDVAYRDVRMLEDTATWENKGGERDLTGFVRGFEVIPYAYLTEFPEEYVETLKGKDVEFTVTLSDTSINGTYGGMTFTNGVATVPLKGGESATAEGLPTSISYKVEEAEAEGVKAEVVFAQIMNETGWLQFGGTVKATQYNFCGLGCVSSDDPGLSFADVRTGIRAQVQHLKAYASTDSLKNTCVDSRFKYVTRGCAPYVEYLGQKENPNGKGWASRVGYGIRLAELIDSIK